MISGRRPFLFWPWINFLASLQPPASFRQFRLSSRTCDHNRHLQLIIQRKNNRGHLNLPTLTTKYMTTGTIVCLLEKLKKYKESMEFFQIFAHTNNGLCYLSNAHHERSSLRKFRHGGKLIPSNLAEPTAYEPDFPGRSCRRRISGRRHRRLRRRTRGLSETFHGPARRHRHGVHPDPASRPHP